MKKIFLLLIITATLTKVVAQKTDSIKSVVSIEDAIKLPEIKPDKNGVYIRVDKMPEFPGGDDALFAFMDTNQRKRPAANGCGIIGTITLRFIITKLGKITNIEVIKSTNTKFNKEAIRLATLLPDFIPGEQNGEKVDVYYTLPVSLRLQ